MKNIKYISIVLLLAAGCSTSKLSTGWVNQRTEIYHKIMVLGLVKTADPGLRENIENSMVTDLKGMGYDAVSSSQEYGSASSEKLTDTATLSKLKSKGVDVIITVALLKNDKTKEFVPGEINNTPYSYSVNLFGQYYNAITSRIGQPGYYDAHEKYYWQNNLYLTDSQKLMYSAQTPLINLSEAGEQQAKFAQLLVGNMVQKSALPDNKEDIVTKP
ncbi:hypothetical protein [Pedobacter sp. L105]|uniref:hypothetical protein n=1 Tax=Pedobacter sp. L105 TaxID=1641871 RepID=UPI00131CD881|nr:hypothetical protein [Pedobacter sp. L105]